ncbi:polysaccharide biosynthesis/export family protein [Sphingomonas montanisoli]|uniref:Polysaccharide export protein n=1 Tax=Sphingomonas montanisoli TaxID=2606412 RepID=A0A5D9C897_9SPHN|nr:polysaccharide biosynthesis/export family protein [Sphingomonas montanisoli]TZG27352.1 polysaccharide export protein [Sphingomonas montanisoli]
MFTELSRRAHLPAASLAMILALSGCASLPSSGPTARQVTSAAGKPEALGFQVVNLDASAFRRLADATRPTTEGRFAPLAQDARVDRIAPGDELQIGIYEVGVTLFGPQASFGGSSGGEDSGTSIRRLSTVSVASDGTIRLPYMGRLQVAGSTAYDVQRMIEQALVGKSQSPQALVTIVSSPANSVYLFGDVGRPGRQPLSAAREHLLDTLAISGGAKVASNDTTVRLTRAGQTATMRLGDIRAGGADDLLLQPGDRIELVKEPRSFSVFGASQKVSQVSFEAPSVSLAEALARVGGPSDAQADPSAVFLFRYNAADIAAGRPVIYRLNLMRPESYLIAQAFPMQDKDLIYIANSASGPVTKFVGIINQLFSPLLTAAIVSDQVRK